MWAPGTILIGYQILIIQGHIDNTYLLQFSI